MEPAVQLDQQDQALMESFKEISPLLALAAEYQRGQDDEPQSKRTRVGAQEGALPQLPGNKNQQASMMHLLSLMAKLVLSHERGLQNLNKQDCFVLYANLEPQGAVPLLTSLSQDWKKQAPAQIDNPKWLTMRTYLMKGLCTELLQRVQKIAKTDPKSQLWEKAQSQGLILPDGSWPFQRWNPENQTLVRSGQAPIQMDRMLKHLTWLIELLDSNHSVIRFHGLRPQQRVIPWCLQVSLREADVWTAMTQLCHCTVWGLLAMSVKQHNQHMSRPAQTLQGLLGKGSNSTSTKGSKGSHKGKESKRG